MLVSVTLLMFTALAWGRLSSTAVAQSSHLRQAPASLPDLPGYPAAASDYRSSADASSPAGSRESAFRQSADSSAHSPQLQQLLNTNGAGAATPTSSPFPLSDLRQGRPSDTASLPALPNNPYRQSAANASPAATGQDYSWSTTAPTAASADQRNFDAGAFSQQRPVGAAQGIAAQGMVPHLAAAPDRPVITPTGYHPPETTGTPVSNSVPTSQATDDLLDRPIAQLGNNESRSSDAAQSFAMPYNTMLQTGIALTVVLALMVGCFWVFRKTAPKSMQGLPLESLEVLGNAPLTAKQHLRLVRVGNRVLLLAVSETHTQTLTEVTDENEVNHLLEQCQGKRTSSSQQTFRSLLSESERDRANGFLGSQQDRILQTTGASPAPRRPLSTHTFEA